MTSLRRLTALDGLRTVAVGLVFAHHVDQGALPGGFVGVDVFFVISGYLITALLLRERQKSGCISLSRFYMRRVLRLYPALLFVVLITMPIAALFNIGYPVLDGIVAVAYLTDFYSNYTFHLTLLLHTWSLSVEEQFYLVWPIVLAFVLKRNLPIRNVLFCMAAGSLLITYIVHRAGYHRLQVIQFLPTSHIPELVSGILLAVAVQFGPKRWLIAVTGVPLAAASFVALGVALFLLPDLWWAFPAATLICWPPVAHLVLHRDSWISAALSARPLVWLGERSYGIYLWHYPIIVLLDKKTSLSSWEIAAISLPLTLAIAAASWRFVEVPFLRMKQRFEPREPPPDPPHV